MSKILSPSLLLTPAPLPSKAPPFTADMTIQTTPYDEPTAGPGQERGHQSCHANRPCPVEAGSSVWYEHVLRRPQINAIRKITDFEAEGQRPRGAPKKVCGT
uniref:Uncharacterized protein n=1 Tax=Haemonchus contortus TaxID=6289 RepID=A0A7I5ECL8_HAECO